jgi:microsomal dipeptidase-like Zn-dependent dipeptidase
VTRARPLFGALAAAFALFALAVDAADAAAAPFKSRYALAGRCVSMRSGAGSPPGVFYMKAAALGTYLLYDQSGQFVTATASGVARSAGASKSSEWRATGPTRAGAFQLHSARGLLAAAPGGQLALGTPSAATRLTFTAATGCARFPEAEVDASGPSGRSLNPNGTVFGFVDSHLHITANMRAGGRVIYGEPFDPLGIQAALGDDAADHGADGSRDITGNLLRTGLPFGTHDTHGWPTFAGWPTHDTMTHQQTYYVWLERAWRAGLRLVVAQTADDAPICRLEPVRNDGCDETRSIKAQIRELRALQDYVDAQSGGPGRGWFRLVTGPAQARRVIARGKLAVVIGIESSDLFGCSESGGRAQCTRRDIDRGLRAYKRLGVRGMFVAHWVDNAFAGAALEGGAKGLFINIFNRFQTGSYFKTGRCPARGQGVTVGSLSQVELQVLAGLFPAAKPLASQPFPTYPKGLQCNARGLTPLGRYLIRRLIAEHMLIEVDHMSERARDAVLAIAARAHYPLISSHNGTGGEWTSAELRKLHALGGYASVTPDTAPKLAAKLRRMARFGFFGVGIGTDTGGFASQPGPRPDASGRPLRYPFRSYDRRVTFTRERTGTRTFDLNTDGVAHYGLMADLVADMQQQRSSRRALPSLFRSAEAYLRTWQRALRHRG